MIGYLEGKLLKKDEDKILLLVNHIGYEILLPAFVMETLRSKSLGEEVALYIYYQQTERQPKPVLIGFNLEAEKEFFLNMISVEDIGPQKAIRAFNIPVRDIARAIESRDIDKLTKLKGIGKRTAEKVIATLNGKMEKFALIRKFEQKELIKAEDFTKQVFEVLVNQLGHKPSEAKEMVTQALKRNKSIETPEALFDEIYRGENI